MSKPKAEKKPSRSKVFAKIENLSIAGFFFPMGPRGLYMYGEHYLAAAKALPKPDVPAAPLRASFEPVRPYLICHAIELFLKSFLSLSGKSLSDLSDNAHGHKLASLLASAEQSGLADYVRLAVDHCRAIRDAEFYYAGKVFEYPAIGETLSAYESMPPVGTLFEAAELLSVGLSSPCKELS